MKKLPLALILCLFLLYLVGTASVFADTSCPGTIISLNYEKRLLPPANTEPCSSTDTGSCGRPGSCTTPKRIVLHTTWGMLSAEDTYNYFAGGSEGRGVGCHFAVGQDGKVIQMVELLEDTVEKVYCVGGYSDHISIEMGSPNPNGNYASKNAAPAPQYQAALTLVKQLMQQYNIPLGNLDYTWKSPVNSYTDLATSGVYGHYQLNPETRSDPGSGWFKDFRADLATNTTLPNDPIQSPDGNCGASGATTGSTVVRSNCVRTIVGNPPDRGQQPVPSISGDPYTAVENQFGVTIQRSLPEDYAVWAWEKLWEVSKTSFTTRVKGTVVGRADDGSFMDGCKKINLRGTYNRSTFRVIFVHEMGHIIRSCSEPSYADEHNIARAAEGQLTNYSQALCSYKDKTKTDWNYESENYAEMIAYYLNPEATAQTGCEPGPNPFANGTHPQQYTVVQQILGPFP